ncbi:putative ribonuclease H-like domain-containing protein [Tanacetum coccineum]
MLQKFPVLAQKFPLLSQQLLLLRETWSIPQDNIDDKGYWDSGYSRHMTGNISYMSEYEPYNGGYVSFGHGGGKITGKGTIKTGKLEFENVYFVKELKYNLFSVSQICDNKNSVMFTDSECLVLGKDFKLDDDTHVLLRTPRQQNMYSIDLKNIVPHKNLTCLIAKASEDESMLWHRRLGHLNFKTMNKLVRNNLVKGLPSKSFENIHTCVACLKGKQHKASCKTKLVSSITKPLHTLHMDLFGPTSVSSLNHKWYCLVVTDDFSRFTWTFFLKSKDETSSILRNFITEIENLKDLKVKIIRCDNGGEFRNKEMDELCTRKGIKREFSNARTPQQNGVAERRNRTLIEAARTMLADAKLPVTFWAEAVNTACYVQNRVLVNKSQNKTPYELFNGRSPAIGFLRPFGCHVMILNTLDHLGKFDAKGDEGTKEDALKENVPSLRYIALLNWFHEAQMATSNDSTKNRDAFLEKGDPQKEQDRIISDTDAPILLLLQKTPQLIKWSLLEDLFGDTTALVSLNEVEADLSNMETNIQVSPSPTLRIHKVYPKNRIIGHVDAPVQTRQKTKNMEEQSFIATIHQKTNPKLLQYCLFSVSYLKKNPRKSLMLSKIQVGMIKGDLNGNTVT